MTKIEEFSANKKETRSNPKKNDLDQHFARDDDDDDDEDDDDEDDDEDVVDEVDEGDE